MTGRARKLSAAERSRREFHGYTSPLEVSFSLLSCKCLFRCSIFVSLGGESVGRGRASGCSVAQGVGG